MQHGKANKEKPGKLSSLVAINTCVINNNNKTILKLKIHFKKLAFGYKEEPG